MTISTDVLWALIPVGIFGVFICVSYFMDWLFPDDIDVKTKEEVDGSHQPEH